jgi:nucleoside-diphosphate-sugar epimerase
LILGGTSLVGRFLEPMMDDGGAFEHQPVALSRTPPRGRGVWDWRQADLTDPAWVKAWAGGDTLLSLSPIWLLNPILPKLLDRGLRRVVAFSSTSRFTKATSPLPEERAVARALAEGEEALCSLCAASGARWTILRPTLIYAEGLDRNVSRLAGLVRRFGLLPLAGDGGGLRQPVHAEDLARGALYALDSPRSLDQAYDLPGGETLTYRQMCERVFQGLGRRPFIVSTPPLLWDWAFRIARPLLPGATSAMGSRMVEDLVFDGRPAQRDFQWSPRAFHPSFQPS